MKATKENFCKANDQAKKLRSNDPIQFNVLYNEWKRNKQNKL